MAKKNTVVVPAARPCMAKYSDVETKFFDIPNMLNAPLLGEKPLTGKELHHVQKILTSPPAAIIINKKVVLRYGFRGAPV